MRSFLYGKIRFSRFFLAFPRFVKKSKILISSCDLQGKNAGGRSSAYPMVMGEFRKVAEKLLLGVVLRDRVVFSGRGDILSDNDWGQLFCGNVTRAQPCIGSTGGPCDSFHE